MFPTETDVKGTKVKQFGEGCISKMEDYGGATPFWFGCSMISTCEPLFDDCDSNYDVEAKLRAAGVITKACVSDTESCELVVNFRRKDTARSFLFRLNSYLVKKAEKLAEARAF